MKLGKLNTKHYLFGFILLFWNSFSLLCLAPITHMKFGRRLMNALVFKLTLVPDNCVMWCVLLDLIPKQWNVILRLKSYVDELAGVGITVRLEEHVDAILEVLTSVYAPIVLVIESKKHAINLLKLKLFYMVMKHYVIVLSRRCKT